MNNLFEKYFCVRNPEQYEQDDLIRSGQSVSYTFDLEDAELSASHRLFFTGETQLFYLWKNEPDMRKMYFQIEDALDSEHAASARYCLNLSATAPLDYAKRALYKIMWPPKLSYLSIRPESDTFDFGISAEVKGLHIKEGGYLRLVLEVWDKKEGWDPLLTGRVPDHTYTLSIPEGSYAMKPLRMPVQISKATTAAVVITLEGLAYEGEAYFESPTLSYIYKKQSYNVLPDFNTVCSDNDFFDWLGMNLSRKEWPVFAIALNGETIYSGELFERCHRYAEMEVAIPAGLLKAKGNCVEFHLLSDYLGALPYAFREVAVLEQPGGHPFDVIAVPRIAHPQKEIPILLKTARPHVTVSFSCESGVLSAPASVCFEKSGLNVFKLRAKAACNHAEFCLSCNGYSQTCEIEQMAEKAEDHVYTGTSDAVYISQNYEEMEEYLSWYVANGVGNFLTIRPIYRWGGARKLNLKTWEMFRRVMTDLGIRYAHMTEGRDLPGLQANPSVAMLEGPMFLGRQMHETDGEVFYWGTHIFGKRKIRQLDMFNGLGQKLYLERPDITDNVYCPANYTVIDKAVTWPHAENVNGDLKQTQEEAVRILTSIRTGTPRHSGPSTLSKCFYQAGFDFFGAELMYGTMETNVSSLRGTAKSYGKNAIGAHHAMQWSSSPHDDPAKYRRYRLALYVGYIQGITQINTEEGLWHIEEYYSYFHRFTEACSAYLKHQQDLTSYVLCHTRRGSYYTPVAFVSGRYDGTVGFGHSGVYGVRDFPEDDPEQSWTDLYKIFYPLSKPGEALYIHNCPHNAVGYYSGTPLGNVDTITAEGNDIYGDYKLLVFGGCHCVTPKDLDRMQRYVENGGTAVLSWAHLSSSTKRDEILSGRHSYAEHALIRLLTGGKTEPKFLTDAVHEKPLEIGTSLCDQAEVLERTDAGAPLKVKIPLGKGTLYFYNAKAFPHNEAICDSYIATVRELTEQYNRQESAWIECGDDVEFTVYDAEQERDIYVLAVDWYRDPQSPRHCTLRIGADSYDISLPFGTLVKIAVQDKTAVFSYDERAEVEFTDRASLKLQGVGKTEFVLLHEGERRTLTADFEKDAECRVALGL